MKIIARPDTFAPSFGNKTAHVGFIWRFVIRETHIPENAEVANAIGASLARTTTELTVLADTEKGTLTIVEEGIQLTIPREFEREDALKICMDKLRERAIKMGAKEDDLEIEITEDQSFNMVRGYYTAGKNIRIKAQVKPGLISNFQKGETR